MRQPWEESYPLINTSIHRGDERRDSLTNGFNRFPISNLKHRARLSKELVESILQRELVAAKNQYGHSCKVKHPVAGKELGVFANFLS